MHMKTTFRYSEAFKAHVVSEIESGKLSSCGEAARRYGIKGSNTVYEWVRRYGRDHLIGKVVRVETVGERNELKRLRHRIRELEALVSDQALRIAVESSYVILACREAGIEDVDGFKKKQIRLWAPDSGVERLSVRQCHGRVRPAGDVAPELLRRPSASAA